jgi:hypothetical protein
MSSYLGRCALGLASDDLQLVLQRFAGGQVGFQHGCFQVHQKLPLGLGITFVAVPQSAPGWLLFNIPFEHIRGDRTGGLARMLAGGLWGPLRGEIEKRIRKELSAHGLPLETVRVEPDSGQKAGRVAMDLQAVNAWLMSRPPMQGLKFSVESCQFGDLGVELQLEVFRA